MEPHEYVAIARAIWPIIFASSPHASPVAPMRRLLDLAALIAEFRGEPLVAADIREPIIEPMLAAGFQADD